MHTCKVGCLRMQKTCCAAICWGGGGGGGGGGAVEGKDCKVNKNNQQHNQSKHTAMLYSQPLLFYTQLHFIMDNWHKRPCIVLNHIHSFTQNHPDSDVNSNTNSTVIS